MAWHPVEIQQMLDDAVILVDTREQATARAKKRYQAFKQYERRALKFGDYSIETSAPNGEKINLENAVSIERKMHLDELCNCFCQGRERFEREFLRAKSAGAHIYLLIENNSLDDAYNGKYRSRMNPSALTASIFAWCIRYEIVPVFISAEKSGIAIRDILMRELKERLESYE